MDLSLRAARPLGNNRRTDPEGSLNSRSISYWSDSTETPERSASLRAAGKDFGDLRLRIDIIW